MYGVKVQNKELNMWKGYTVGAIFRYKQDEAPFRPQSSVYECPSLYVYDDGCEIRDCTEIDAEYDGDEDDRIISIRDDVSLNQLVLHQIPPHLYTLHLLRPKSAIWIGVGDSSHG